MQEYFKGIQRKRSESELNTTGYDVLRRKKKKTKKKTRKVHFFFFFKSRHHTFVWNPLKITCKEHLYTLYPKVLQRAHTYI